MGRPAINTVFNNVDAHKTDREAFNTTQPVEQPALFEQHFQDVLTSLGAADPAGLAGVLLPDVLTYQTGNTSGFLNGRRLKDDVIDAELGLVTNGGITTDCVANDSAITKALAVPRTGQLSASQTRLGIPGTAARRSPGRHIRGRLGRAVLPRSRHCSRSPSCRVPVPQLEPVRGHRRVARAPAIAVNNAADLTNPQTRDLRLWRAWTRPTLTGASPSGSSAPRPPLTQRTTGARSAMSSI